MARAIDWLREAANITRGGVKHKALLTTCHFEPCRHGCVFSLGDIFLLRGGCAEYFVLQHLGSSECLFLHLFTKKTGTVRSNTFKKTRKDHRVAQLRAPRSSNAAKSRQRAHS